jgi:hypothetical protein
LKLEKKKASAANAGRRDFMDSARNTPNVAEPQERDSMLAAQLALFTIRAAEIFDRVLTGKLLMVDAADLLFDASVASGLDAAVGTDQIQKLLACAFASASAERDRALTAFTATEGEKP